MPHSPSSPFLSSPTSEIKQTDNKQGKAHISLLHPCKLLLLLQNLLSAQHSQLELDTVPPQGNAEVSPDFQKPPAGICGPKSHSLQRSAGQRRLLYTREGFS